MKVCMVLSLAFVIVLSACSGNNEPEGSASASPSETAQPTASAEPTTTPDADKEPVELQFVWWGPAGDANWQRMFDAFTAKYPWITIEVLQTTDVIQGVGQMVTESIAAGDPIDLFWNNSFDYVVKQDLAEDLTPYIEKDEAFKAWPFKEGYLEQFQHDGKQLGLAHGNDAFLIFVNKELLNQYGLEMPTADWTWDDFREMAKQATDPAAKHYGVAFSPATNFFWWSYSSQLLPYANGHSPNIGGMNEDFTKSLADGSSPEILDDLNFFYDMMTKDGSMLNTKRATEVGLEATDTWATGQSLFQVYVSPGIAGYKTSLPFEWDILPMPKGTAKQGNFSWINPWFMSKGSDNKEEAWLFMQWWETDKEAQKLLYDIGGTFPNTTDAEMLEAFNATPLYEGLNKDSLKRAIDTAVFDPTQSMIGGADYLNLWTTYNVKGGEEETSAHDYFPAAAQQLNEKLAAANAQ